MPDLLQSFLKHDLGHLKIIAGFWGLELNSQDMDSATEELSASLLDPQAVRETIDILPAESVRALISLLEAGGKMEWGWFARTYGEIREMGPGKRDREKPHHNPTSTAETLFYRGLVAKAFFDSEKGTQEFAYIPDDLSSLIHNQIGRPGGPSTVTTNEPLGRVATPVERSFEFPASDRVLDDATTFLAALRIGKPDSKPDAKLTSLLTSAKILRKNVLQAEAVKKFLEMPRQEALETLQTAWLESTTFNELRLIPGLSCEGEWANDPLAARQFLLNLVNSLPDGKWWNLSAFVRDIKTKHPDFQRPAGDYDSWFIKRASDGEYLRGFECWDEVDGALIRYFIQILHWLGNADLAGAEDRGAITSFRLSSPSHMRDETGRISIASNGKITIPRTFSRAVRYQIARFCEWLDEKKDEYIYSASAQSLKRASGQGLKAEQLLSLLVKHTNGNVPPALVKALKRWEASGVEARVESLHVLRVTRPEILKELRRSKSGKFLGEILSPTAVVVKEGAVQKVMAALAELGLLAEVENDG